MIYALLPKNVASRNLRAFVGQIRQGGGGWGVNPILAMPGFWVHLGVQPTPKAIEVIEYRNLDLVLSGFCAW